MSQFLILSGDDIVSHLVIARILSVMEPSEVSIHFDVTKPGANHPEKLADFYAAERSIIGHRLASGEIGELPYLAGVRTLVDRKVGGSEFREWVDQRYPTSTVSIRCYQKLSRADLDFLSRRRPVSNLHPGLLPEYRGVLTFAHAVKNQDRLGGWTLHQMVEDWDAGPIHSTVSYSLDHRVSVIENMAAAVTLVAAQVVSHWRDEVSVAVAQDPSAAGYVTHLSDDDLAALDAQGTRLGDSDWIAAAYEHLGLRLSDDERRTLDRS